MLLQRASHARSSDSMVLDTRGFVAQTYDAGCLRSVVIVLDNPACQASSWVTLSTTSNHVSRCSAALRLRTCSEPPAPARNLNDASILTAQETQISPPPPRAPKRP